MKLLLPYYMFFVAGAVLVAALHKSSLVPEKRTLYVSYLLTPPLVMIIGGLDLGLSITLWFGLVLIMAVDRLLRKHARLEVTGSTFRLGLCIWLAEAVLPLLLHFSFKSRPEIEKWALILGALTLFVGTLLASLVFAPDLRRRTS